MARKKTSTKASSSTGGRASAEAIEKRRTARHLNTLLSDGSSDRLDGRTEKRRRRLIRELKEGRRGQPLKPIDVLTHVSELMDIGETVQSLRKEGVKPRKADQDDEVTEAAIRTQAAYGFRPEAWKMLGIRLPADATAASTKGRRRSAQTKRPGKKP